MTEKPYILRSQNWTEALKITFYYLKSQPLTLAVIFLASFTANEFLSESARSTMHSMDGPWLSQVGKFLVALVEGYFLMVLGTFFLLNNKTPIGWSAFFKNYLNTLTAELLRFIARSLLYSLALIIPGVVMYARLGFFNFVVALDPEYQKRPDAVIVCLELTRQCWGRITLLNVFFGVVGGALELSPDLLNIDDLWLRSLFAATTFIANLYMFVIMYLVFENLKANRKG